jgi:hypothetical protein
MSVVLRLLQYLYFNAQISKPYVSEEIADIFCTFCQDCVSTKFVSNHCSEFLKCGEMYLPSQEMLHPKQINVFICFSIELSTTTLFPIETCTLNDINLDFIPDMFTPNRFVVVCKVYRGMFSVNHHTSLTNVPGQLQTIY